MKIQNYCYLNTNKNIAFRAQDKTLQTKNLKDDKPLIHGYTKFFKHHWMDATQMCAIIQTSANTNRYIGSPPKGWLVNGTYEKKKEQTQEIFAAFSDFSEKISDVSPDDDDFSAIVGNFNDNISGILNKDVKVSYLEQGSLGKVFKIELDGKKYVLKNFKKSCATGNGHGRSEEQQRAIYVQNNEQKGAYSKFYFGKLAKPDDHDGFYVSEFCENTKCKEPVKKLSSEEKRRQGFKVPFIVSQDSNSANTISGKIVDYGDLTMDFPQLKDGKLRKYVRVVCDFMRNDKEDEAVDYINKYKNDKQMLEALKIIEYATASKTGFFYDSFIEKHDINFSFQ